MTLTSRNAKMIDVIFLCVDIVAIRMTEALNRFEEYEEFCIKIVNMHYLTQCITLPLPSKCSESKIG